MLISNNSRTTLSSALPSKSYSKQQKSMKVPSMNKKPSSQINLVTYFYLRLHSIVEKRSNKRNRANERVWSCPRSARVYRARESALFRKDHIRSDRHGQFCFRISQETTGLSIPAYHFIPPDHIVKSPIH